MMSKAFKKKFSIILLSLSVLLLLPLVKSTFSRFHGDDYDVNQKLSSPWQPSVSTFYNPIVDHYSPDPYVTKVDGTYWLILSDSVQLTVYKSDILSNFRTAEKSIVYQQQEGFSLLWAPEIHKIDGQWFIYFAMFGGGFSHRTYVMQAKNSSNPLGEWGQPIRMQLDAVNDLWAIDSTVLQYGNGKKYLIWSAWPRELPPYITNGSLYIAQLDDPPIKIKGERILIREPSQPWESALNGQYMVNEGPQILQRGGPQDNQTFIIFSAAAAGEPNYCLGLMGIDDLRDPLIASNWWTKTDGPVFWMNEQESVFTTGHCSLTTSKDDSESWIMYHAVDEISDDLIDKRRSRVQKFDWDPVTGLPVFPRPAGIQRPLTVPSGEE